MPGRLLLSVGDGYVTKDEKKKGEVQMHKGLEE